MFRTLRNNERRNKEDTGSIKWKNYEHWYKQPLNEWQLDWIFRTLWINERRDKEDVRSIKRKNYGHFEHEYELSWTEWQVDFIRNRDNFKIRSAYWLTRFIEQ